MLMMHNLSFYRKNTIADIDFRMEPKTTLSFQEYDLPLQDSPVDAVKQDCFYLYL